MRKLKLNKEKVLSEMERQGLTGEDIVRQLGLTRTAWYWLIDAERPSILKVERLAKILKLDPKDLLV